MRRKLFIFFILILFFGVSITGFISYDFTKDWIMQSTKDTLSEDTKIVEGYLNQNNKQQSYDDLAIYIKNITGKRVTIIKQDGTVIGESDLPSADLANHLDRTEVRQAIRNNEGASIRYSDTEKIPMYYYARKVNINNEQYIIRIAVQFHDIKIIQYRYLKLIIMTIIAGTIIASILVYLYIKIFTEPIINLTKVASTISLGNYQRRINVSSKDEIGQLGNSFNLMAQRLQDTIVSLADKNNKLISILTSSDDGVIVVDNDERILLINPAAQRLFKVYEDAIGKYFLEVIRNSEIENIIKDIPKEDVELTINFPETKYLRIKASHAISYENGNEIIGVLIIIHDITKIRKLEKMRSDFVSNVSHELKTPLTSIKGFAETLRYVEDKPTRDKFLDIINIESERLTRLINDILTLSELENKDQSLSLEKIDVSRSLEEVVYIMKPIAENKSISISYNFERDKIIINGNTDKFKQMIINIVDNAIKYTDDNGKVEIILSSNEEKAIISVKDTGIGIPQQYVPRLFERFYRVDKGRSRSSGGTGLGLAIVKHIAKLLNGEIEVKSQVGEGTVFTIYLPLVNSELTEV